MIFLDKIMKNQKKNNKKQNMENILGFKWNKKNKKILIKIPI